jgi:hypothetical protein
LIRRLRFLTATVFLNSAFAAGTAMWFGVVVSPVLLALVAGGLLSSGREDGVAAAAEPAAAAEFFVSPTGRDTTPGTADKPFATLERAWDAVRQLRSADGKPLGGKPLGGITIWLRAGDYLRTAALELSAADSGTAEAPVVCRAWQDETVRLLGGRTLSGFRPVTDPAVLHRLQEEARGACGRSTCGRWASTSTGR